MTALEPGHVVPRLTTLSLHLRPIRGLLFILVILIQVDLGITRPAPTSSFLAISSGDSNCLFKKSE